MGEPEDMSPGEGAEETPAPVPVPHDAAANDVALRSGGVLTRGTEGALPPSQPLNHDQRRDLAVAEGYSLTSVDSSLQPVHTSQVVFWGTISVSCLLMFVAFPENRFPSLSFDALQKRPPLDEVPTITERILADASPGDEPWMRVVFDAQHALREKESREAIKDLRENLKRLKAPQMERWKWVYYLYWDTLLECGKFGEVRVNAQEYLHVHRDDARAAISYARAIAEDIESREKEVRSDILEEYCDYLQTAVSFLHGSLRNLQIAAGKRTEKEAAELEGDIVNLKLQLASIALLQWEASRYKNDGSRDLAYRIGRALQEQGTGGARAIEIQVEVLKNLRIGLSGVELPGNTDPLDRSQIEDLRVERKSDLKLQQQSEKK